MSFVFPDMLRVGHPVSADLFGVNMLFHRNDIGPDGTFDEVLTALNAGSLRYPGGSIAEDHFDIRNPDATSAIDPASGATITLEPLSDVAGLAALTDRGLCVVLPTRQFLSGDFDALGHRFAAVDTLAVRDFVTRLVSGEFGAARIEALEIGNEYWGMGDGAQAMTTVEYGRVAAQMVGAVSDALGSVPGGKDVAILVQFGHNYGPADLRADYAGGPRGDALRATVERDLDLDLPGDVVRRDGDLDWTKVANHLIIDALSKDGVLDQVDGVVTHVYSRHPVIPGSRTWPFDVIEDTWARALPDVEIHITEWSRKIGTDAFDRTQDYGLNTADEMVDMMGLFSAEPRVAQAHYWTAQHNTATSLARMTDTGDADPDALTAAGEAFRMMAQSLPGLSVLDLAPDDRNSIALAADGLELKAFAGADRMVLYLGSLSDDARQASLDLSPLLSDFGTVTITRLSVAEGHPPGDPRSDPVVDQVPADTAMDGSTLRVGLQARGLVELVIGQPVYTPTLAAALAQDAVTDNPSDPEDPESPPPADDGGFGAGLIALLLLPMLAALGMG